MKGFAIAAALAALPAAWAQGGADWPLYNRDLAGTRYSPLTQINTSNVQNLKHAWTYRLMPLGGIPDPASPTELFQEVTPIVINGVMYLPARGNQVLALDGDTGKEIWRYQMPPTVTTTARGVAYWPGEAGIAPRIILTAGPRLLALDAATGQPAAGFGRDRKSVV